MSKTYIFLLTSIFLVASSTTYYVETVAYRPGFVLITTLYNEKNKERCAEFITCVERNLAHPFINVVHILYDVAKDDNQNVLHDRLTSIDSEKLVISYINGRPTYGHCFNLANTVYYGNPIIVCNGDIYFNNTLQHLVDYDLTNRFLALTRWDVKADGQIKLFSGRIHGRDDSQDAWIFQSPLPPFKKDDITMGVLDCDGRIAFRAREAGLEVINPCYTIQCCHMHLSGVRNYSDRVGSYPHHEAILVPCVSLSKH